MEDDDESVCTYNIGLHLQIQKMYERKSASEIIEIAMREWVFARIQIVKKRVSDGTNMK